MYAGSSSFATTTRVCNVLSIDFVRKSEFDSCFWSAQCIETQARTSDNPKTWIFISLNVQWWSFLDKVVYCNTLRSIEAASLELKKAMLTGSILVLMFNTITPGPYTQFNQSKVFKLNVTWRWTVTKKLVLITKCDCMNVTDLNHTVRYIGHVVDLCSKVHKYFQDCYLFSVSDQLVVGIDFSCFWLKNYKNVVLRYGMTIKQNFCVQESLD